MMITMMMMIYKALIWKYTDCQSFPTWCVLTDLDRAFFRLLFLCLVLLADEYWLSELSTEPALLVLLGDLEARWRRFLLREWPPRSSSDSEPGGCGMNSTVNFLHVIMITTTYYRSGSPTSKYIQHQKCDA